MKRKTQSSSNCSDYKNKFLEKIYKKAIMYQLFMNKSKKIKNKGFTCQMQAATANKIDVQIIQ